MFKIKKYRKESTDPAQLVDSVEQAARQAKENMRWLVTGVAGVVLVGATVGGVLWMRQQEDRAAADLFYEATQHASEPSRTGAPPAPRRPEDLQKAIETFRKILTDFPNSSVAPQAAYLFGNALSERKDWDGAIKAYQDFLARYGANRLLVPLVYQRMAYAQLAQGKLDAAEKTYTAIVQMPSAPNTDHALYELGTINELLNRPEGALADRAVGGLVAERDHPPMVALSIRMGVGLACLSLVTFLSALGGVLWLAGLGALPAIAYGFVCAIRAGVQVRPLRASGAAGVGGCLLGGVWLVAWLWATIPPTFYDELVYHLVIPQRVLATGELLTLPWVVFTLMPHASDLLLAWGLVLGGDLGARAIQFALWVMWHQ